MGRKLIIIVLSSCVKYVLNMHNLMETVPLFLLLGSVWYNSCSRLLLLSHRHSLGSPVRDPMLKIFITRLIESMISISVLVDNGVSSHG